MDFVVDFFALNLPDQVAVITGFAQVVIACLLFWLASRQLCSQRLQIIEVVLSRHHSSEITRLRADALSLPTWVNNRSVEAVNNDPGFAAKKSIFEDAMNYYENLGMLAEADQAAHDVIVKLVHNSATRIHDLVLVPYLSYFQPENGRVASDYAGSFRNLAKRGVKYRSRKRIR